VRRESRIDHRDTRARLRERRILSVTMGAPTQDEVCGAEESSWSAIKPLVRASFPFTLRLNLHLARFLVPGLRCHAILRDGRPIAALVTRRGRVFDEVVSVVVAAGYRRDGLARRLVSAFLAESISAGRPVVAWVRRSNAASRRFFESLGFRRARVWALPYAFEEILPWGDHYVR
jgi:ribosomal protein S18 acetylase RimI-like enzyme